MNKLVATFAFLLAHRLADAGGLQPAPGVAKLCVDDGQGRVTEAVRPLIADCTGTCLTIARSLCQEAHNTLLANAATGTRSHVTGTSWQTAVVTGLGDLVADRAKAEVSTWFEDLVRDKLCDAKTGNERWFPSTCALLKDDMGLGQQLMSPLLLQAIEDDVPAFLAGLAAAISKHVEPRVRPVLTALPVLVVLGAKIVDGRSPFELLAEAAREPYLQKQCRDRATRDDVTGPCLLLFAGITLDYYGPLIATDVSSLEELQRLAVKLLADGSYRCAMYKAFNEDARGCPDASSTLGKIPARLKSLVSATVITSETKIAQLFVVIRDAAAVNAYLADISRAGSLSPDAADTQLARMLDLLDVMWKDIGTFVWDSDAPPSFALFHHAFAAGSALGRKQYRELVLQLVALATTSKAELPDWITRLIPLVVDLAEANNAAAVSAAFARAAAPIGSWKLKRRKPLLSITALVGLGGGYEVPVHGRLGSQIAESGVAGGLITPIGVEMSHPWGASSIGLLFSVLDVGQLTWSRLQETAASSTKAGTKSLPDADLSQVFSPGAHLVIGAGASPFTFGAGASYAPDLRAYTYEVGSAQVVQNVSVWRLGLFVAIDVTLFPF